MSIWTNFITRLKGSKDIREWRESFRSMDGTRVVSITYFCEKTKEFKTVKGDEMQETKSWWKHIIDFDTKTNPERIKYAKDLLQPFNPDGTVNPAYVKAYNKDPRQEHSHRNYARNIHNKGFGQNMAVDADLRKFERKKYGL